MTDQPQTFAVGIDFGTTNSTICLCPPDGRPAIVPIRQLPDGQTLPWLPGFIYFPSGRKVVVGQAARRYYHLKPHRTVRSVKRDLDRVFTVGGRTYSGADLVLFVEVKTRSSLRRGSGAEAVTTAKLARILGAAKVYRALHAGCGRRFRFDVADVLWEAGRPPSIRYIENVYHEE